MKNKGDPEKIYTTAVRRLHFLLPLATLVPCICQIVFIGMKDAAKTEYAAKIMMPLYLESLLLALPVSLVYYAKDKMKKLWEFSLCAAMTVAIFILIAPMIAALTGINTGGVGQAVCLALLIIFVVDAVQMRLSDNERIRSKRDADLSWTGDQYLLPKPSFWWLLWFGILYIASLFLHNTQLGNIALTGAIFYFTIVYIYVSLDRKEDYLSKRRGVSGIPEESMSRLYRRRIISVVIPSALVGVISILTGSGRRFLDLPVIRYTVNINRTGQQDFPICDLMLRLQLMDLQKRSAPPPQWIITLIDLLENALSVAAFALLFWAVWKILTAVARNFRTEVQDEDRWKEVGVRDEHTSLLKKRSAREKGPGNVRRKYRRTILRARGQAPGISETPAQMEALSGLAGDPGMEKLHTEYELERYGDAGAEKSHTEQEAGTLW